MASIIGGDIATIFDGQVFLIPDLDGLHTVLLTRCAMDVALLMPPDCSEFTKRGNGARAVVIKQGKIIKQIVLTDLWEAMQPFFVAEI